MTSCVEKLNVLLDHWAFFEINHNDPDLNYWNRVIQQEYLDDKMDANTAAAEDEEGEDAAAAADIAAADAISDTSSSASATCIPLPNDLRCRGKTKDGLNYTTYCPIRSELSNCNLKNVCVTESSHCMLNQQAAMAANSKKLGQDKISWRSVQGSMRINNQAKKK